jgi:hypothetical protein
VRWFIENCDGFGGPKNLPFAAAAIMLLTTTARLSVDAREKDDGHVWWKKLTDNDIQVVFGKNAKHVAEMLKRDTDFARAMLVGVYGVKAMDFMDMVFGYHAISVDVNSALSGENKIPEKLLRGMCGFWPKQIKSGAEEDGYSTVLNTIVELYIKVCTRS